MQVRQATEAQSEAAALAQALRDRDAAAADERARREATEARELSERREAAAALASAQAGLMDLFTRGLGTATDGFFAALQAHAPPQPLPQSSDQYPETKDILAEVRAEHDRQLRTLVDLFSAQHAAALRASAAATAAAAGAGSVVAGLTTEPESAGLPNMPPPSVTAGVADETAAYSADFEESGAGSSSVHDSVEPGDSSTSQPTSDHGVVATAAASTAAMSPSIEDSVADEIGSLAEEEAESINAFTGSAGGTTSAAADKATASSLRPSAASSHSSHAILAPAAVDVASRRTKSTAVVAAAAAAPRADDHSPEASSIGEESAAAAASADSSVPEDDLRSASPLAARAGRSDDHVASASGSAAATLAHKGTAGGWISSNASEIEDDVPVVASSSISSEVASAAASSSVAEAQGRRPAPAVAVASTAAVVSDNSASASASAAEAYSEDFEDGDSGGGGGGATSAAKGAVLDGAAANAARVDAGETSGAGWEADEDAIWGATPGLLLPEAPPELAGDPTTAAALAAVRRSLREEGARCRDQLALLRMRESAADEAAAAELARVGEALRQLVAAGGGGGEDEMAAAAVRQLDERDRRVRLRLAAERAELARLRAEARSEALRRQLMLHEQAISFSMRLDAASYEPIALVLAARYHSTSMFLCRYLFHV